MRDIHRDVPIRDFVRPDGIVEVEVSARSGLLPPADYSGPTIEEVFIAGTQPTVFDQLEQFERRREPVLVDRLRTGLRNADFSLDNASGERFTTELDLSLNSGVPRDAGNSFDLGSSSSRSDRATSPSDGRDDSDDAGGQSGNPLLD
jgi:hypothetical protein